jgi:hypothetical protein
MRYPYYRQTKHTSLTATDAWFDHHEALGIPVAQVVSETPKGPRASIWVVGREYIGPKGLGNHEAHSKEPNGEHLDKACIVKEANGFSEAMGV